MKVNQSLILHSSPVSQLPPPFRIVGLAPHAFGFVYSGSPITDSERKIRLAESDKEIQGFLLIANEWAWRPGEQSIHQRSHGISWDATR